MATSCKHNRLWGGGGGGGGGGTAVVSPAVLGL